MIRRLIILYFTPSLSLFHIHTTCVAASHEVRHAYKQCIGCVVELTMEEVVSYGCPVCWWWHRALLIGEKVVLISMSCLQFFLTRMRILNFVYLLLFFCFVSGLSSVPCEAAIWEFLCIEILEGKSWCRTWHIRPIRRGWKAGKGQKVGRVHAHKLRSLLS